MILIVLAVGVAEKGCEAPHALISVRIVPRVLVRYDLDRGLSNLQCLGDLFRPCKPLQLSEGFQEGGPRLEKGFHRLFFSAAVLNTIAYEGHNVGGAWLIKRCTSCSKYTLFFIKMQHLSKEMKF